LAAFGGARRLFGGAGRQSQPAVLSGRSRNSPRNSASSCRSRPPPPLLLLTPSSVILFKRSSRSAKDEELGRKRTGRPAARSLARPLARSPSARDRRAPVPPALHSPSRFSKPLGDPAEPYVRTRFLAAMQA
jgi:hypothetical protein